MRNGSFVASCDATIVVIALAFAALTAACGGGGRTRPAAGATSGAPAPSPAASAAQGSATSKSPSAFTLASSAFVDNGVIPRTYSCDGASTSPPLAWSGTPGGVQEFALIVDDPDAPVQGGFTHWVAYDIAEDTTALAAGYGAGPSLLPITGKQGSNGGGRLGYTGPCPPPGDAAHHYDFRLYALDAPLGLPAGKSKADVLAAMQGHIIGEAELVGLYGR
jgi:hypothetical protein